MQQEGKKDQGQYGCGHGFRNNECMRVSRKFCQRGSSFDKVFLVYEGREDTAGHHRPASDGPALNSGLAAFGFSWGSRPVLLKNPKQQYF